MFHPLTHKDLVQRLRFREDKSLDAQRSNNAYSRAMLFDPFSLGDTGLALDYSRKLSSDDPSERGTRDNSQRR